ncbi:MAG: hypothetical protein MUC56_11950 [Thermoanaerobaculales bacterium]|jgi:hypothetical protein|nr:hypothetical protein [Thermoanaerobaculales bacterium]
MRPTCPVSAVLALALALIAGAQEAVVPDRLSIDALANLHPAVELDHAVHAEIAGDCASCHHRPFGEPAACASCHDEPVVPSAFVHEQHWEIESCTGCHDRGATTDLRCVSCHPVEPDPERLEVIGLKGAYHGLCLGCHETAGPEASCAPCHPAP